MYSRVELAKKYFKYYFKASHKAGHGIHSPFVFNFIRHVLNDHNLYPAYREIELVRHNMLHTHRVIEVEDLGAGSALSKLKSRKISDIAREAVKPRKYGQLIYRLCHYFQPRQVVELGTSLGLTTAYLAKGFPESRVITIEGAPEIAAVARQNFRDLKLKNTRILEGNFDDILPKLMEELESVDLVFIDGNHREQATLNYLLMLLEKTNPSSILIFDDIHWSAEMEEAWETIKGHPAVKITIDLFFMGFVFFREEFKMKTEFYTQVLNTQLGNERIKWVRRNRKPGFPGRRVSPRIQ